MSIVPLTMILMKSQNGGVVTLSWIVYIWSVALNKIFCIVKRFFITRRKHRTFTTEFKEQGLLQLRTENAQLEVEMVLFVCAY